MKRLLKLSALLILYLLFSAKSCDREEQNNEARQQRTIRAARDSIVSVLGSDTLSAATINGFEETAKIKFADFLDYLDLLSDTTLAPEFRQHAGEMIRGLFLNESAVLQLAGPGMIRKEVTLTELLDPASVAAGKIRVPEPDSLWVMEALLPVNDTLLKGKLGLSLILPASADPGKYELAGKAVDFYAVKCRKVFGRDTVKIWTVLLGTNKP